MLTVLVSINYPDPVSNRTRLTEGYDLDQSRYQKWLSMNRNSTGPDSGDNDLLDFS